MRPMLKPASSEMELWARRHGILPKGMIRHAGLCVFYADFPGNRDSEPWHDHPAVSLELTLRGGYTGVMGDRKREYKAGHVEVIPAGEAHSAIPWQKPTRCFHLRCEDRAISPALVGRYVDDEAVGPASLSDALFRMYRECQIGDTSARLSLESEAASILDPVWNPDAPCGSAELARDLLHDTIDESWALGRIADDLNVDASHLCRSFKRTYGCTMGEYQRRLRLRRALRALAHTDTPIAMVALDAGFADQSHLGRELRRRLGVTPAAYRSSTRS